MHKRLKLQKIMIAVLAIIVAVLAITALFSRKQTVDVLVVKKEINLRKSLDEQLGSFEKVQISKQDFESIGGRKLVVNLDQLKGKHLQYKIEKGNAVPLGLLDDEMAPGEFAADMTENYTVYRILQGVSKLPLGVVTGDRINVALTAGVKKEVNGEVVDVLTSGILLRNVLVYEIDEVDVYVKVTEQEALMFANASQIGQFVLQLPGKKEVPTCDELEAEIEKDVKKFIEKEAKKNPKAVYDQEKMVKEKKEQAHCKQDGQQATTVDANSILEKINSTKEKEEEEEYESFEIEDEEDESSDSDEIINE